MNLLELTETMLLKINAGVFREYDIRGRAGQDLSHGFATVNQHFFVIRTIENCNFSIFEKVQRGPQKKVVLQLR
jgi:hypothetical protein